MRTRPLGKSGIEASVVALGTWVMGGWMWGGMDEDQAVRALHVAIDMGLNLIDTAPIYGFGVSEEVVGRALAGRREKAVIATKCGMVTNVRDGRFMMRSTARGPSEFGHIPVMVHLSPASIRWEVEGSLQRLKTDRIDLYQTHWQEVSDAAGASPAINPTPIEDTMGELVRLKEQGKIRAIGVCNASSKDMARYASVGSLDSDQEKFSMLDRKIEQDQLPFTRAHDMAVLAYSPLVLGLLTGKAGPERQFEVGDQRRTHKRFTAENRAKVAAMLKDFEPIAQKHRCSLGQLAIAWTIAQPGVTHALVGARDEAQVRENAGGAMVELSPEDLTAMNAAIARHAPGIV